MTYYTKGKNIHKLVLIEKSSGSGPTGKNVRGTSEFLNPKLLMEIFLNVIYAIQYITLQKAARCLGKYQQSLSRL